MLNPSDRAVLKTKKYLVNVTKIGAAGAVGQVVKRKVEGWTDFLTGKPLKEVVHTGYENEFPVSSEVRTRTLGRARMVSNETIMTAVQERANFEVDAEFEQVSAADMASASIIKGFTLFFDLNKIDDPIVAKKSEAATIDIVAAFKPSLRRKNKIKIGIPRRK